MFTPESLYWEGEDRDRKYRVAIGPRGELAVSVRSASDSAWSEPIALDPVGAITLRAAL